MTCKRQHSDEPGPPRLAIRRHTDRCFHEVEEVVHDASNEVIMGYILDGVMVDVDDVAEVRTVPEVRG